MAVLTALGMVVAIVLRPTSHSEQLVVRDEPTAAPSEAGTPTAAPSEASPTSAPSTTDPPDGSGPSPAPVPEKALVVDSAHLLPTSYARAAFAEGRAASVYQPGPTSVRASSSCRLRSTVEASPRAVTSRVWAWPGEVLVLQELMRMRSSSDAAGFLHYQRACGEDEPGGLPSRSLPLGDEAFVAQLGRSADGCCEPQAKGVAESTTLTGAVRVGDALVLLTWRRSGWTRSDADVDGLARVLDDALGLAQGERTPEAPVLAGAKPAPGFERFLRITDVVAAEDVSRDGDAHHDSGLDLSFDLDARIEAGPDCARPEAKQGPGSAASARLPINGPSLIRIWHGGPQNAADFWAVREMVAHAVDEDTARTDFAACRAAAHAAEDDGDSVVTDLEGIGDEAFSFAGLGIDGKSEAVYVRVGATYLVIFECEYADARALARAAVVKYA